MRNDNSGSDNMKLLPGRMKRSITLMVRFLVILSIVIFSLAAIAGCAGKKNAGVGKDSTSTSTSVSAQSSPAGEAASASQTSNASAADSAAQAAATPFAKLASYEEQLGANLFAKYCSVCHGLEGKGDGFNAFNLDPHPRDLSDSTYMAAMSDEQIVQTIASGGRSLNKSPLMPAYGKTLNRDQIRNLASFVRTLPSQKP